VVGWGAQGIVGAEVLREWRECEEIEASATMQDKESVAADGRSVYARRHISSKEQRHVYL
ncbi:MAG: hypothetical protein WD114_01095, partial [Phycisphaerales bacterium]